MEKLATDTCDFEKPVRNGFTYVDKTDRLLPLVDASIGFRFCIARPRRFGKSLTVSAIRQIKAKHYADRFAGNGKTLTLIGLAFSKAKRTIVAAKVEEVS